MPRPKSICVFCGARNNVADEYLEEGRRFGKLLADEGITLVYGGADCGIMGAVANAVLEHEGNVIGVFPEHLRELEKEHTNLTELYVVPNMHERKMLMFEKAEAFVVFPGGFGTMDETFEIITWKQLHIHSKPVVIFNHNGYWDPWVDMTENILEQGFASEETRELYKVVYDMDSILRATTPVEP